MSCTHLMSVHGCERGCERGGVVGIRERWNGGEKEGYCVWGEREGRRQRSQSGIIPGGSTRIYGFHTFTWCVSCVHVRILNISTHAPADHVDLLNQPRVSTGRDDAIGTQPQSELSLIKHVRKCLYELHRKLLLPKIITCQEKVSSAGSCWRRLVLRSPGQSHILMLQDCGEKSLRFMSREPPCKEPLLQAGN